MRFNFIPSEIQLTLKDVLSLAEEQGVREFGTILFDNKRQEDFNNLSFGLDKSEIILERTFTYKRKTEEEGNEQIKKCFAIIDKLKDNHATFNTELVGSDDLATYELNINIEVLK